MALITGKSKTHLINTDKNFRDLAKSGDLKDFRTSVAKNTYPRWGADHPTIAVDDVLEFVTTSAKHRWVVFNKNHTYVVTGIELERDMNDHEWNWVIRFDKG